MKTLRILLILLSCSFLSYGQDYNVSGKIIDVRDQAIEFANIIVYNDDQSSVLKGTSTDENGFFILNNLESNTYILKISFIGYQTYEQKVVLTGSLDLKTIRLEDAVESLDQVFVIGKKPSITRKPDRLIFNIENTALTEGSTLSVLKSTPGVIVSDGGINIKSSPATIFINNRRVQLTSQELITLLDSAPANSIKSVEVITSPPASYDADSGSVINIIMSKNLVTGYRGSVFTNYIQGVFPRYKAGTSHYFKNNKVNLNVNYNYTNQKINRDQDDQVNFFDAVNEIDQIWNSNVNRNTWSKTHNLNLNFDYYLDNKNTLSLTSTGLYTPHYKYQIRNNTNIFDENMVFQSRFTADNLSRDTKYNLGTDLIFRHDFDNSAALTFKAHYTIYDYKRDQNVFSNVFNQNNEFDSSSEFNTLANQDTQIITGKVDYNLPINENSNFDAGLKYSNINTESDITKFDIISGSEIIDPNNTDAFEYDEKVFAAYSNYTQSWSNWDLSLGLRLEQTNIEGESLTLAETNTQDYFNWFPNAGLSHQILEDISIYATYKRSITRPSYTDLNPFTFFINENNVVLGNPNLVPTYRDHYIIGTSFLDHFTVEAYYMNYDGDIVELPRQNNTTNIIEYTPTNLDSKVDFGFDFAFDYYPTNTWNLYFVTSIYNITEEANFGDGFVELSHWSNYSILQNSFSMLEDRSLNVNLTLTWVGKNLQQLQIVEDRLFSEFSVTKAILNKKGIISLSVEDLFNLQDSDSSLRYRNQSSSSFVNSDNRFIKLGFRYKFGNTKLNTNEPDPHEEEREERQRIKDLN